MKTINRQSILIVEPDRQIREEIFNFLLSAGYEKIEEVDSLAAAVDEIRQSAYQAVVADAGEPLTAGMQFAAELAQFSPPTRIILMIDAEDQQTWDRIEVQAVDVQFLIKTDFARNLLFLLEE